MSICRTCFERKRETVREVLKREMLWDYGTEPQRQVSHEEQSIMSMVDCEHPITEMFYLNEYDTNRQYGGPEEGGWWYNVGTFVKCHGSFASLEAAQVAKSHKKEWLDAMHRDQRHSPGSVLCSGWTQLIVEEFPGWDYPENTPHYE